MMPRDPHRIPETLRLIQKVWETMPDLRLGQLLLNAIDPAPSCPKLYNMEDDVLLRHLGVTNPPPVRLESTAGNCPLCGNSNDCEVFRTGDVNADCWCRHVSMDPKLLEQLPASCQGRCLCQECVREGGVC